jgi:hypothetical protein
MTFITAFYDLYQNEKGHKHKSETITTQSPPYTYSADPLVSEAMNWSEQTKRIKTAGRIDNNGQVQNLRIAKKPGQKTKMSVTPFSQALLRLTRRIR